MGPPQAEKSRLWRDVSKFVRSKKERRNELFFKYFFLTFYMSSLWSILQEGSNHMSRNLVANFLYES